MICLLDFHVFADLTLIKGNLLTYLVGGVAYWLAAFFA